MAESRWKAPFLGFRGGWLLFWITFACATDMTLFGYDQGVFSGVVVTDNFLELHDLVGPERTEILSTVAAIYDIGCFLGALFAFSYGERMGRKKAIIWGTTIMSVGVIIKTSSSHLAQMIVGRVVLGIGNGINTATAPVWQTETASAKWRGKLVILEMMMNIFGFMMVNWINYGFSFIGGGVAWRFPLGFQFIFIVLLYATVPWLPESPRWLIAHDRDDEAAVVISALADKSATDPIVVTEMKEIRYSVQYEREHSIRWRDLLKPQAGATKTLRRLLLGANTQLMQQFQGINIMSYYLPTVLIEAVGLSNTLARLLSAVNSVTYFIFSCAAVLLIERWGRRGLMLLSSAGQGFALLMVTILLARNAITGVEALATASIPFFFVFYIAFGLGMLGIPWLYPTEINSLPMRTKGAALATMTNWLTNFVVVQITPIGIRNLGWRFWIIFTVCNAASIPVIYFLYPETANRSLEDMDDYFRGQPGLIVTKDFDAISQKRPQRFIDREQAELERSKAEERKNAGLEFAEGKEVGGMVSHLEVDSDKQA